MRKMESAIAILTLLTVCTIGISIYAYSQPLPTQFYFRYYQAIELSEKPDKYFALNESHVYAIEAIKKPGQTVGVDLRILNETTGEYVDANGISDTFEADASRYGTHNVEYQGKYYLIDNVWVEPPLFASFGRILRKILPAVWIALTVSWAGILIIFIYNRKTQRRIK